MSFWTIRAWERSRNIIRSPKVRDPACHVVPATPTWIGCGRFLQWLLKPQEVTLPKNMQRQGQPHDHGVIPIVPRASDISNAGRSGIIPVRRHEA
jgi:hypothetical protein